MIIQEIQLENFRQYKGRITIAFSTDSEKNVTVIIGDNTCGKTTLVQSFIWCLYGHADFKDKQVLNAEEYADLENKVEGSFKQCSVRVALNHNDTNYLIERIEKYRINKNGHIDVEPQFEIYDDSKKQNSYNLVDVQDRDIIASILPENLSDYFFFWGERIEKLSERKEIAQAVKQFLGLETIELAQKHLKKAINSLSAGGAQGFNDAEIQGCNLKIKQYEDKNRQLQRALDDVENNINFYTDKKDEYFSILTSSKNQELQSKQNEYLNKSKQLDTKKKDLEKYKLQFTKRYNDSHNYVYVLGNQLEKRAVQLLKDNPEPVRGWNYIDINAINEILKRKKCICGNEICEGSHAYNYLLEQKDLVAPNVVGGTINSFIEGSERRESMNKVYLEIIHDLMGQIRNSEDEISELNEQIAILSKEITKVGNLQETQQRYNSAIQKLNEYCEKKGALLQEIQKNTQQINLCENKRARLIAQNQKYQKQAREIQLARDVLSSFDIDYKEDEEKLIDSLRKHVNENFQKAYNGNRKIEIDERYNAIPLNMVNNEWIRSETSPGLETVKNFSFIAGLVQCAKEQIVTSKDYGNAVQNKYPLVLDAPFSQADEKHIPAISELLSNNADQIILVVMQKDWNYAKNILNEKVGKKYNLKKITETCTEVIEG